MATRRGISIKGGVLLVAFASGAALSVWAFQDREAIVAAYVKTVDGVTSRLAHSHEPFGQGSTAQHKYPILGVVPDFSLTEASGRTVKKSDLKGSFWVASFVFTRCATSCPMTVVELASLQDELPSEVRLVSITVDPEYDSPEVLSEYAKNVGADVDRWIFLTGDKDDIYRCIREGFHLAVQENPEGKPGWEVAHSPRLALVDAKGQIRGYYNSSDGEDVARLRSDIDQLLERARDTS